MLNLRLAGACAVVLLVLPSLASAKPKVALTPIAGDASGDISEAVADALVDDVAVIEPKTVNRAVDKHGYEGTLNEKQAKKLASELEADALIQGKLAKSGGRKSLHLTLYIHGKKAKGFTIKFKNIKTLKDDDNKSEIRDTIMAKLGKQARDADSDDQVAAADKPTKKGKKKMTEAVDDEDPLSGKKTKKIAKADAMADDDAEAHRPAKGKKGKKAAAADDDADAPMPKGKAKRVATADDDAASDDAPKATKGKKAKKAPVADDEADALATSKKPVDDGDDAGSDAAGSDDSAAKPKKRVARADDDADDTSVTAAVAKVSPGSTTGPTALRVDAGVSLANRSLTFTSRPNFPEAPKPFQNAPVPGARVEGEIYPLALMNRHSALAGFGIAGMYDKTLALTLHTTNEPGVAVPATQQRFAIGARYRFAFGQWGMGPSVTLGVDFGNRAYVANRSGLTDPNDLDLPNTNYTMYEPGVSARWPIGRHLALIGGGKGMLITNTGAIQKNDSYGKATVFGFEGQAGLDVMFGRIAVRVVGEYAKIGYTFAGTGDLSRNRDNDPMTQDVGGAADQSMGAAATLAVMY